MQFRNSPTKGPNSPYPAHPKVPQPDDDDIGAYYVQAGPVTFRGLQARVVGGTTWHWGGLTLRYRPNDFVLKSKFGVGVDWPLVVHRLEPWYGEAEREIGVCGPARLRLGIAALHALSDAADRADVPRHGDRRRVRQGRPLDGAVSARAQLGGPRRTPAVLRQRVVRSDLPDRRQVRRVGARREGGGRGRARRAARDRARDRRRQRPQGDARSASSGPTAAWTRRAARSSSSPRTRSRRRSCC